MDLCACACTSTVAVLDAPQVHVKHTDGSFEYIPYFCLPANDLNDVIAPSCYSCFDYPNALADMVVRGWVCFWVQGISSGIGLKGFA